ncbi:MAG: GNAT family N-acetyltransferase [Candidatus Nanopelagicales bacterium]
MRALEETERLIELVRIAEEFDTGITITSAADLSECVGEMAELLGVRTAGVFCETMLVGYCIYFGADRYTATVHPAFRGKGIGSSLVRWVRAVARKNSQPIIGTNVLAGSDAEQLLRNEGFVPRYLTWLMRWDPNSFGAVHLPHGYRITTATPEQYEDAWDLLEDGFLEWTARDRIPARVWLVNVVENSALSTPGLRVLMRHAEIVGASLIEISGEIGTLQRVAVRVDERRNGFGAALVRDAFDCLASRAATRLELFVDQRSGARALYDALGMTVDIEFLHLATGSPTRGLPEMELYS